MNNLINVMKMDNGIKPTYNVLESLWRKKKNLRDEITKITHRVDNYFHSKMNFLQLFRFFIILPLVISNTVSAYKKIQ